ncbi:MAG: hypothetical protein ABI910_08220 [Gemmatimonadota bacterium]
MRSLRASLRFHAAAGARVALRNSVIGTMGAVFVMGSAPQPPGLFRPLASGVAGAESSPWSLTLVAILGAALARQAVPQLSAGYAGWMRSLPTSSVARRRALVGALVMAQAPLLVFVLCAWVIVLVTPQWHVAPVKLMACVLILLGAAMLAVPVGRRATVVVASLIAMVAATTASGVGLVVSLLSLIFADRVAESDSAPARAPRRRRQPGATLLPYRIAWRAISWRAIGPLVYAVLPVGFAWLMCVNNQMVGAEATTVMRTGGTLGVVVTVAGLASVLQLRRPTWAWARSLPTSSAERVLHDAVTLLAAVVPVWVVVAAVDVRGAVAVVTVSPLVALLAAAAMRRAGARITGAQGEVLAVGLLIVVAVSQSWWLTLACISLTPAALLLATRRERMGAATQWNERHHSTVGDALAWTRP